jgi:hypothetical protein
MSKPDVAAVEGSKSVEFSGIRISIDKIQTTRKGKSTFTVPRSEISYLELRKGFTAERPTIQIAFALVLLLLGLLPVRTIVAWAIYGGTLYDVVIIMLGFLPFGGWLLVSGLHRGKYIFIKLNSHKKNKLAFSGRPSDDDIRRFAGEASRELGCIISGV